MCGQPSSSVGGGAGMCMRSIYYPGTSNTAAGEKGEKTPFVVKRITSEHNYEACINKSLLAVCEYACLHKV